MRAYRGDRSKAPPILNVSIRWEWLGSRPGHFTSGGENWKMGAGWAPEQVWIFWSWG